MAKRKNNKNQNKNTTSNDASPGPSNLWRVVKILLLLGVGYALGWNFGYVSGRDEAQVAAGGGTSGGASNTDAYGRSPGHPHFGHAHN